MAQRVMSAFVSIKEQASLRSGGTRYDWVEMNGRTAPSKVAMAISFTLTSLIDATGIP